MPKLGKLDPHPESTHPRVKLRDHLTGGPAIPTVVDWYGSVASWGMLLNDTLGDCVAPDTLVLTADLHWVQAGDLELGDKLLAYEESPAPGSTHGRKYSDSVVEKNARVIRDCYELTFDDGTAVIASAGHKWLVRSQIQGQLGNQSWLATEDLRCDDVNPHRVYKPLDTWQEDRSWAAGFAAAAFDGEGNLDLKGRGYSISFNQTQNSMLEEARSVLKELGFEWTESVNDRHKLKRIDGSSRKTLYSLKIGRKRETTRFLGSIRPRRLLDLYPGADCWGYLDSTTVKIISKTYIGPREVVMLDTTSRTYFANGLASHNCTAAGALHMFQEMTAAAGDEATPTDAMALSLYERFGYNPNAPLVNGENPTDQGAVEQDVLQSLVTEPADGQSLQLFAQVDHTNADEMKSALAIFGCLYVGIQCPESMQQQFAAGQVIDYVPGSPVEGGHCIIIVGWDADYLYAVTWGALVKVTWAFWEHMGDEAWVVVTDAWLEKNGDSPSGLNLQSLTAEFQSLTSAPAPRPAPAHHAKPGFFQRIWNWLQSVL